MMLPTTRFAPPFSSFPAQIVAGLLLCLFGILPAVPAQADGPNLLPEGSDFEAGLNGFGVTPMILLSNWKTYVAPSIDTTTAAHGRCSLKLVNGSGADVFRVSSQGIRISHPSGPITLSLYAKTDTPGCALSFTVNNGFMAICQGSATLTKDWQRFHVMVTPPQWYFPGNAGLRDTFYVQIVVPSTTPWKTIWLDGVQLEHGGLTPYNNPAPVDLAFTTDRHIKLYHADEVPQIVLHAAGKDITAQPVTVQVEELFTQHKEPLLHLPLTPGVDADHGSVTIPLKPEPRGLYRLTARMADGRGFQQVAYGVIKSMAGRPHDQAAFFGGSIESIFSATISPSWGFPLTKQDSLMSFDYPPAEVFATAHDLGWGWWHAYWAFCFQVIQPDGPDQFRWRDSDALLDLAQKNGLDVYVNLATHGGPTQQPKWAWSNIPVEGGTWNHFQGEKLVDAAKFGAFARAMAEHYKGRIFMYEPYNEPNVKMSAPLYVPIQEQVYNNLKAVDPRNQIYGLCGTQDVNGDLFGWVKTCIKLGLGQYMDGIAIHGYHVPRADYVAEVRRIARTLTGKDYPIIDSEAGGSNGAVYTHLMPAMTDDNRPSMTPQGLVEHIANDRVYGAARQSWFNLSVSQSGIFAHSYDLLEYDGAPSMPLIAYNTFIDFVGTSTTHQVVPVGGNVVCYVFGAKDHSVALLWAGGDSRQVVVPVTADEVSVLGLAGQVLHPARQGRTLTLNLTNSAIYLRAAHLSADQLARKLARITIPGLNQVVIERAAIGRATDGRPELVATVKGNVPHPKPGLIQILESPEGWRFGASMATYPAIPLDHTVPVKFPILAGLNQGADKPLRLGADSGADVVSQTFDLKVWPADKVATAPTLEAGLAGWNPSSFHRLSDWAKAAIVWDAQGLYVAVQADDRTPCNFQPSSGKADWQSDSVELYFNPDINSQFRQPQYGPSACQVICPVSGEGSVKDVVHVAWRGFQPPSPQFGNTFVKPGSIHARSVRDARGYHMVIFVPWTNFPPTLKPAEGSYLGFSLSVRDMSRDCTQLRRVIWSGADDNYSVTTGLGVLVLK